jgi:hypothetical protein
MATILQNVFILVHLFAVEVFSLYCRRGASAGEPMPGAPRQ